MKISDLLEKGYKLNYCKDLGDDYEEMPIISEEILNREIRFDYNPYFSTDYYYDFYEKCFTKYKINTGGFLTVTIPIEIHFSEEIEKLKNEIDILNNLHLVAINHTMYNKEISKRTETAINRVAAVKLKSNICRYSNYYSKILTFNHLGVLLDISIQGNTPEENWNYINKVFIDTITSQKIQYEQLEKEKSQLDVYRNLSNKMKILQDEIDTIVSGHSRLVLTHFPYLFKQVR